MRGDIQSDTERTVTGLVLTCVALTARDGGLAGVAMKIEQLAWYKITTHGDLHNDPVTFFPLSLHAATSLDNGAAHLMTHANGQR